MTRRKTRYLAATAAALVLAATAACGGGSGDDGASGSGLLRLGVVKAPESMAAKDADWGPLSPYAQAVYDSLLGQKPDGEVVPGLATEWSYNDDKTVLTLKLRTGVKFTDGTAFDAEAAAQNLLRNQKGAHIGTALALVEDAKAVDPQTLQITLKEPDPALLVSLAQVAGLQESPKRFDTPDEKTLPVGTGPYVLDTDRTVVGSKYVYTKNSGYWNKDQQHYDELQINVYENPSAGVNALKGRQIDVAQIQNAQRKEAEAVGYSVMEAGAPTWTGLLLFDREGKLNPALGEVKVRQAINHAIDAKAMVKALALQDEAAPTNQIFAPGSPAYDPALDTAYPYDPAKAKQLLAEAGHPDGVTIKMPLMQAAGSAAADLTKQYLGDVGIKVEYVNETLQSAVPKILGGAYPVTVFSLNAEINVWRAATTSLSPSALYNPLHSTDSKVASLLKTVQTGDDGQAAEAGKQLNEHLVEQAWFAPWVRFTGFVTASGATSVTPQDDNAYPLLQNIKPKS